MSESKNMLMRGNDSQGETLYGPSPVLQQVELPSNFRMACSNPGVESDCLDRYHTILHAEWQVDYLSTAISIHAKQPNINRQPQF